MAPSALNGCSLDAEADSSTDGHYHVPKICPLPFQYRVRWLCEGPPTSHSPTSVAHSHAFKVTNVRVARRIERQ